MQLFNTVHTSISILYIGLLVIASCRVRLHQISLSHLAVGRSGFHHGIGTYNIGIHAREIFQAAVSVSPS